MSTSQVTLAQLRELSAAAAFNRWAGFEVTLVEAGLVELRLEWREEFGQYAGFLHAGVVAGLIDTVCGFAAVSLTGAPVLASHCGVDFLAPAKGEAFVAQGRVVKAGRRQLFTRAELTAEAAGGTTLVATGDTILVPA